MVFSCGYDQGNPDSGDTGRYLVFRLLLQDRTVLRRAMVVESASGARRALAIPVQDSRAGRNAISCRGVVSIQIATIVDIDVDHDDAIQHSISLRDDTSHDCLESHESIDCF